MKDWLLKSLTKEMYDEKDARNGCLFDCELQIERRRGKSK